MRRVESIIIVNMHYERRRQLCEQCSGESFGGERAASLDKALIVRSVNESTRRLSRQRVVPRSVSMLHQIEAQNHFNLSECTARYFTEDVSSRSLQTCENWRFDKDDTY